MHSFTSPREASFHPSATASNSFCSVCTSLMITRMLLPPLMIHMSTLQRRDSEQKRPRETEGAAEVSRSESDVTDKSDLRAVLRKDSSLLHVNLVVETRQGDDAAARKTVDPLVLSNLVTRFDSVLVRHL